MERQDSPEAALIDMDRELGLLQQRLERMLAEVRRRREPVDDDVFGGQLAADDR